MVKLLKQYVEAFHHGLREMLVVLERLHGGGLCCRPVVVMLDGEADDFVDALLTLGDMICWRSETCLVNMKAKQIWYQVQARRGAVGMVETEIQTGVPVILMCVHTYVV